MVGRNRVQSFNFFRSRLIRITDNEELNEVLRDMQNEQREMRRAINAMMWGMRGSLSREEAWTLSHYEREDIKKLMEEHRDLTEKTGLPLL